MILVLWIVGAWLLNVLALAVADWLLDGVTIDDTGTLLLAAAVFGIVNVLVKPLLTLIALPLIVITLGIVLFFINMAMLGLTAWIVGGFDIDGFWNYVGATIIVWLVNVFVSLLIGARTRG